MSRLRFAYAKRGKVRYLSHRDVARCWERALRRASLPVAATQGFSPRPRVHFGLALPTGAESTAEYLDVDFREDEPVPDAASLPELLSPLLPPGIDVTAAVPVEPGTTSLQEAVTSCAWDVTVADEAAPPGAAPPVDDLDERVAAVLAAAALPVTRIRKGKTSTDDVRPAVLDLAVSDGVVRAELATRPRALRPAELVGVLGTVVGARPLVELRTLRTHHWIALPGARVEPLAPEATERRTLMERAS